MAIFRPGNQRVGLGASSYTAPAGASSVIWTQEVFANPPGQWVVSEPEVWRAPRSGLYVLTGFARLTPAEDAALSVSLRPLDGAGLLALTRVDVLGGRLYGLSMAALAEFVEGERVDMRLFSTAGTIAVTGGTAGTTLSATRVGPVRFTG